MLYFCFCTKKEKSKFLSFTAFKVSFHATLSINNSSLLDMIQDARCAWPYQVLSDVGGLQGNICRFLWGAGDRKWGGAWMVPCRWTLGCLLSVWDKQILDVASPAQRVSMRHLTTANSYYFRCKQIKPLENTPPVSTWCVWMCILTYHHRYFLCLCGFVSVNHNRKQQAPLLVLVFLVSSLLVQSWT